MTPRGQSWTTSGTWLLRRLFWVGLFTVAISGYAPDPMKKTAPGPVPTRTLGQAASQVGGGNAFISSDPDALTWTIGNDAIRVVFRLTATNDFILDQIRSPTTNRLLNSVAAPDSTVVINGVASALGSSSGGWAFGGAAVFEIGTGVRLAFTFRSSRAPVTAVRSYACYPGSPAVEMWTTYMATGSASVTVSNANIWQVSVPAGIVHYALGLREDAAGSPDDSAFTLESAVIDPGDQVVLTSQRRSSEQNLPVIATDLPSDELFGGLLWSGSWQIAASRIGDALRVSGGVPGVTTTVDAAHPLEAPHGFMGFAPGGLGSVSEAMRAFVVQGLRQGRGFQPFVTYNTWFAYGTDIDEQTMMDEMTAAASMGVELFVIDAGWYLGSGGGLDFDSGLGTWEVDPARFPNGLGALRVYAHSLGMRFGLWVEPERVDLSLVNRSGSVLEAWLATNNGSYQAARTAQVCFASSAARQWVLDKLTRLLDDVQPDYLKWDNNLWVNCNRPGHGHGSTDGNYAHVAGLYDVLGALRSRYPTMDIENCSQGGNRLDFGMLRFSDTAWMDDRTSPAVHVRHNLEGLMTFFPPRYLLSFAIADSSEPLIDAPDLPLYLRSRMPGILGLTYRSADLGALDRDRIASEIGLAKKVRDAMREASGRLLTEQADPVDGPSWDALQELDSGSGNATLFVFQNDPVVGQVNIRPEGLDGSSVYAITDIDGTLAASASGADLMAGGLDIGASSDSSAHVFFLTRGPLASPARAPQRSRAPRTASPPRVRK